MKPIPGPYCVTKFYDDEYLIYRPWDVVVTPRTARVFGSAVGAHIAQVKFVAPTAGPTPEQALANANLLAAAPTAMSLLYEADHFITRLRSIANNQGHIDTTVNVGYLEDLGQRIAGTTVGFDWEWLPNQNGE